MISLDDLEGNNGGVNLNPIYNQLNIINVNTSSLRIDVNDILSSISTMSGGGGFDYTEKFSARSSLRLGYNISDNVSSISLSDVIKFNFGPNCTFNECTFNSIRSLTINDVANKCAFSTIRNGKLFGDVLTCSFKTCSMLDMTGQDYIASCQFSTARFVNVICSDFLSNTIYGAYNWNINCNNLYNDRFIAGDKVNINAFTASGFSANNITTLNFSGGNMLSITFNFETINNQTGNITACNYYQNEYLNLCGESLSACQISECGNVYLEYKTIQTNTLSDIKSLYISGSNILENDMSSIYYASIDGFFISSHYIQNPYGIYNLNCSSYSDVMIDGYPNPIGEVNITCDLGVSIGCQKIKKINMYGKTVQTASMASVGTLSIKCDSLCDFSAQSINDMWLDIKSYKKLDSNSPLYMAQIEILHIPNYLCNNSDFTFNYNADSISWVDFSDNMPINYISNGVFDSAAAGFLYLNTQHIMVKGIPISHYTNTCNV
ncbi:MAG: hypothetical protein VZR33_03990 [Methanosphaera sp.]|nr:hypothetical protein [Methanosphaera sp.]